MKSRRNFFASTKRDAAFISRGFTYWKEGPSSFRRHAATDCHKEDVESLIVLPTVTRDVSELHDNEIAADREKNRAVFNVVLKNIKFLARQGLALRGDGDEFNSNLIQLLHLTGCPGVNVKDWLDRKAKK